VNKLVMLDRGTVRNM